MTFARQPLAECPLRVKDGRAEHVAAAAGSPHLADQLAVGQRDGGELMPRTPLDAPQFLA